MVAASANAPMVRVSGTTHRIQVVAEDRDGVDVAGRATVRDEAGVVTVDEVSSRLTVRVPIGSSVVVGNMTGRVEVLGAVGDASVVVGTGAVRIDTADRVDVRSGSGKVVIGHTTGNCRVKAGTGLVSVAECAGADLSTTSGRVVVGGARGDVRVHCVTGRIDVTMSEANDVEAETVSGRIDVRLPRGTVFHRATSGESRPVGADCVVVARSTTGKVVVRAG